MNDQSEAQEEGSIVDQKEEPDAGEDEAQGKAWASDLKDIVRLAGPAILQLAFQQAVIVTNQSMAGHLGPDELAAAAIAVTWFNLMWFFIIGASSALDTLASQSFGAGDRPGVISWSVSAAVILSVMAIPMAVALYVAESVAKTIFQQPPEIAELVGVYCHGILPGLWPFIWSLIIMKAMQAQNLMWGPTWVTIGMFFANIAMNFVLIRLFGFTGAAYAQSASRIVLLLMLILYICTIGGSCIQFDRAAWILESTEDFADGSLEDPLLDKESTKEDVPYQHPTLRQTIAEGFQLQRLGRFFGLGFAGGLMMAADASSFDITTAEAGFLGVEEVGAHTSLLTIVEFIYTSFPYGIATAATIRVGNMLGAGNARSARQSAYICLAGCACFNITVMILFFAFGNYVGYIFTNDKTVVSIVAKLSVLAGLYQIPDCVYGSVSGILRGTGRQSSLMWTNLAGFWGVGMPLSYYLTFVRKMGVEGLWVALCSGLAASALFVLIMLLRLDWEAEAESAQRQALLKAQEDEDASMEDEESAFDGDDIFSAAESTPSSPRLRALRTREVEGSSHSREPSPERRRPRSAPVDVHTVLASRQNTPILGGHSFTRSVNSHL